ncbi:hypothetical protein HID58_024773 [Brassica napus]|uniref:Uncharacterized protein n=1 Tax=Brassica napus TaxID=3708 RepID=A0ABQ8CJ47_BRANA|nr:hypothetical protein HID58_024773 [Brassica napus]
MSDVRIMTVKSYPSLIWGMMLM